MRDHRASRTWSTRRSAGCSTCSICRPRWFAAGTASVPARRATRNDVLIGEGAAMAGQETTFAEQSWAFALKLYGRPGVSEACLRLQSVAATDVMFLLVVLFAATQKNIDLRSDDISGLDDACRPWREQVIKPLRGVRSALKTLAPAQRSAEAEALRARV